MVCQGMPGGPAHILAHSAKGIGSVQRGPFKVKNLLFQIIPQEWAQMMVYKVNFEWTQ